MESLVLSHPPLKTIRFLSSMLASMRHRGPDGQSTWSIEVAGKRLSLGHTRLAILDLSDAAQQPMVDPSSGCVLIYNGELYNYVQLREELIRANEGPFKSTGDSEVFLRAYVHWGIGFVKKAARDVRILHL